MEKLKQVWREIEQSCSTWSRRLTEGDGRHSTIRGLQRWGGATFLILLVTAAGGIGTRPGFLRRYVAPTRRIDPGTTSHMSHPPLNASRALVPPASPASDSLRQAYSQLPLSFEANQGQVPSAVRFVSRGDGYILYLTSDGALLGLRRSLRRSSEGLSDRRPSPEERLSPPWVLDSRYSKYREGLRRRRADSSLLRLSLVGSNKKAALAGINPLPGKINLYRGSDPGKWHTGISTFSQVRYSEVYPGVDLVFYGNQRRLEYDFRVAPGADFQPVAWKLQGIEDSTLATNLDSQGNLLVHLHGGTLRLDKPTAYEILANSPATEGERRRFLDARYTLKGARTFGFAVFGHDPKKMLVIDPVLQYSTYLGGSQDDAGEGIALDTNGNVYVTGQTFSTNFPLLDAAQSTCVSCTDKSPSSDAFVTKFEATGASLSYSTFLGGSAMNIASAIVVDSAGNAYVAGQTTSTDFPTTSGAYQMTCTSCALSPPLSNAFVTKFDGSGSVGFSTYLGGNKNDQAFGIALDSSGNVVVTGAAGSSDFPTTTNAYQTAFGGGTTDAFVATLDPSGAHLLYGSYLGGSNTDAGYGIVVDPSGVYIAGETSSNNFPTVSPFQEAFTGATEGFITKIKPDGTGLIYSTYLGGSSTNGINSIAVDASENAYVTGSTSSSDFPVTPGAFQTVYGGGTSDAFVAKLDPTGAHLVYSSYLGGSGADNGNGIAVDSSGTANIVGQTVSPDFPTANPIQPNYAGNTDAFVTRFVPSGCAPVFSTFFGGHSTDIGTAITVDSSGNAYVTGGTTSNDFPVQSPFQANTGGDSDAFLARMNTVAAPAVCLNVNSLTFPGQVLTTTSASQSLMVTNGGSGNMSISGVTTSGDFSETNTCGNSLATGSNCTVDVTFSPTAAGTRTGTITITDNAGSSPRTIPLSGVGTDFGVSVYPASATVTAGGSATYTLTLTPISGFNSAVTLKCGGAPSSANCGFSSSTPTLTGTSATTVTITVTTESRTNSSGLFHGLKGPGGWGGTGGIVLLVLALSTLILFVRASKLPREFNVANCLRLAVIACLVGAVALAPCCGFSSNAPTGTPAGSYTLTLTGSDGALQHSTGVGLTVN